MEGLIIPNMSFEGMNRVEHALLHRTPVQLPDEHAFFISSAPFLFLMSGAPDQAPDVSPRGDAPGFVRIVDGSRLQLPDRIGNNRIDTLRNVLKDPRVGIVFLVPRDERVLRVTGTAVIRSDPWLLKEFAYRGQLPRSVMEVSVTSSSLDRISAFERSGFWAENSAVESAAMPSMGAIMADQVGGMTKEEAERFVAYSYQYKLY